MLRAIYILLLELHPRFFREAFGDEMLWIFDQQKQRLGLIADAVRSLATQWMFRSESDNQPVLASDRVPSFYTSGSEIPPPAALINGLFGSVIVFGIVAYLLAHNGGHPYVFTYYGSDFHAGAPLYGPSNGAPPETSFEAAQPPTLWTRVKAIFRKSPTGIDVPPKALRQEVGPPIVGAVGAGSGTAAGPIVEVPEKQAEAMFHFSHVPILRALDTDHDGTISAKEIEEAPEVLLALDKDEDFKLDPEELGYHPRLAKVIPPPPGKPVYRKLSPELARRAELDYMRREPVLAALDADHDGVISMSEIQNARAALKRLDRNHDGALSLAEVMPDPAILEMVVDFHLDTNFDRKISRVERDTPLAGRLRNLLDAAEHDGFVTWDDLEREIRRRADLNHDGVVTFDEMLKARREGILYGRKPVGNKR
jgi:Ca2+-binding EF-hand superfamily protein